MTPCEHPEDDDHACREIGDLLQGIKQFKQRFYRDSPVLMQELARQGQSPPVLVISCSDSRVDPAMLSGAGPGQLFVLRNVANLVPPYDPDQFYQSAGAGIEYAVRDLQVDHVIVLGHAHCGGIQAMLGGGSGQWRDFLSTWVSLALEASELYLSEKDAQGKPVRVSLERLRDNPALVERAAIAGSLKNLLTYPWLRERVEAGNLQLHGWWFDLDSGDLWATEPGGLQLMPVLD